MPAAILEARTEAMLRSSVARPFCCSTAEMILSAAAMSSPSGLTIAPRFSSTCFFRLRTSKSVPARISMVSAAPVQPLRERETVLGIGRP